MAQKDSMKEYGDIINLPHHVSKKHPQMSMHDRAAQFSPFSALTGHEAAIRETARLTEEKIDLDETMKTTLDETLAWVMERANEKTIVMITYFKKDERKAGGSYEVSQGRIRRIDFYERVILMEDRTKIPLDDIVGIEVSAEANSESEFGTLRWD